MTRDQTPGTDDRGHALRKILGSPSAQLPSRKDVDYEAVLLKMIDDFLAHALTFDEFETQFSDCYIDEMPDDALSAEPFDFFSRVHEKFSWTGSDLDDESRRFGWIDQLEFPDWLSSQRAAYGVGAPPT
jgi:hypothetical protein